jgi:hypothetical protein
MDYFGQLGKSRNKFIIIKTDTGRGHQPQLRRDANTRRLSRYRPGHNEPGATLRPGLEPPDCKVINAVVFFPWHIQQWWQTNAVL